MKPPEYHKKRRQERRKRFLALLGGRCEDCGSTKNLHFDHKNPAKKKFPISRYLNSADDKVYDELNKCQLLCSDCHAKKTRRDWDFTYPEAEHGTVHRYKKYKCRCEPCRTAMSNYYYNNAI